MDIPARRQTEESTPYRENFSLAEEVYFTARFDASLGERPEGTREGLANAALEGHPEKTQQRLFPGPRAPTLLALTRSDSCT